MKILGLRVYLELPKLKEYNFTLDPSTQRQLKDEELSKFDRLKVYGVGENVGNSAGAVEKPIKVGDEILIDPTGLRKGFPIKVDGKDIIVVNFYDILHVW